MSQKQVTGTGAGERTLRDIEGRHLCGKTDRVFTLGEIAEGLRELRGTGPAP